jgi:hypothetical protein
VLAVLELVAHRFPVVLGQTPVLLLLVYPFFLA